MNPFQRARSEALRIRKLLAPGVSDQPIIAKDLLENFEEVLDFSLLNTPAKHPDLGGGSALLHRKDHQILIRDDFDVWGEEYCALIAHELGHWVLDPEATDNKISDLVDVLGPDGTPGIIKVEAYGARERQELQANVFARELLLPRETARVIAERKEDTKLIADRLGIPHDWLRQQMLDGLLLPRIKVDTGKLKPPSPDQKKAATASEQYVNVVAGPGTGKTTTLIHRVKYLIEEKKVPASQILVVTFTNKAALELVERLRIAEIENASDIWAGTFHAFGLEFLRKYHDKFDLDADLTVADRMHSVMALANALPQLRLKFYLRTDNPYSWLGGVMTAITRLKEEMVSPGAYLEYINNNPVLDEDLQRRREDVATLYEVHEAILRQQGIVDFVDLVALPAVAINDDRAKFTEILDRYQYVLVDEYQDVTKAMVELVSAIALKKNMWVVGDIRQAIHHWRGASLESLLKFDEQHSKNAAGGQIEKYALECNRRSSEEVLQLVKRVGEDHVLQGTFAHDDLIAEKGPCGQLPNLITCESRQVVLEAISDQIKDLDSCGISYGSQAVLCRAKDEVIRVVEHLNECGLPVLYIGELTDRKEIKSLLCMMQILTERRPRSLIGLKSLPGLVMSKEDIELLLVITESKEYQYGRWLKMNTPGLSEGGEKIKQRLNNFLGEYNSFSSAWSFICNMILQVGFALPKLDDNSVSAWVMRLAFWQMAYSARNVDSGTNKLSIKEYIRQIQIRSQIGDGMGVRELPIEAAALDGVRIETVHSSKGLEFDAVHVGFVNASHFAYDYKPWRPFDHVMYLVPPEALGNTETEYLHEEEVERNNLLYVAVSRAKSRLAVYQTDAWPDEITPQLKNCGEYVNELKYKAGGGRSNVELNIFSHVLPSPIPYKEFEEYARCGQQYYYDQVLSLDKEYEIDNSYIARAAVMVALRTVAESGDNPNIAFATAWKSYDLPDENEDPSLHADAMSIYKNGLVIVRQCLKNGGSVVQLNSIVAGMTIELPWGILAKRGVENYLTFIRYSPRNVQTFKKLLKPLIAGLGIEGIPLVNIQYLISNKNERAETTSWIEKTDGYKAALKLKHGQYEPKKGRLCSTCAYSTICPAILA